MPANKAEHIETIRQLRAAREARRLAAELISQAKELGLKVTWEAGQCECPLPDERVANEGAER